MIALEHDRKKVFDYILAKESARLGLGPQVTAALCELLDY